MERKSRNKEREQRNFGGTLVKIEMISMVKNTRKSKENTGVIVALIPFINLWRIYNMEKKAEAKREKTQNLE